MILINNLKAHNKLLSEELNDAIAVVVKSGWYILGQELIGFEREFAVYSDTKYCVGVANGTDALELALRAIGVSNGDAVITVANAGGYSTSAILAIGAIPHYVDVNEENLTMSVEALSSAITRNVKAIVVTHLFGRMADIHELISIADEYSIPVIEDCAQTHGARLNGKCAGSFGVMGCFSFYPTKNLGAFGDAGAVTTKSVELDARLRELRQYGWSKKYHADIRGGVNSRVDEIQAAILRVKLKHLDEWNIMRRKVAHRYSSDLKIIDIITPGNMDDSYVAHLYVIRLKRRELLAEELRKNEISTDIHYPVPDHKQKMMRHVDFRQGDLTVTERSCEEVLTLPCYPELTESEVDKVIENVRNVFDQKHSQNNKIN